MGGGAAPVFFGGSLYALRRLFEMCIRDRRTGALLEQYGTYEANGMAFAAVSYTHLDVYKRQSRYCLRTFSRLMALTSDVSMPDSEILAGIRSTPSS